MKLSKKVLGGLSLAVVGLFFTACSATQLNPGAERIIVSRTSAPKGCRFLGSAVGNQGGSFAGHWTSNANLAQGALNDLKNKAHSMGGNYVVLEVNQAGNTMQGSSSWGWGSMSGGQTDVTNTGNIYQCPPQEIGLNG